MQVRSELAKGQRKIKSSMLLHFGFLCQKGNNAVVISSQSPLLFHRLVFTLDRLFCKGDVKVFIKEDVGDFWLPIIYRTS